MASRNRRDWDNIFDNLVEYIKKNKGFPSKKDDRSLYTWCALQRLRKKNGQLEAERVHKLDSINFVWNLHKKVWMQNYNEVKKFRQKHPNRWPSQRSKEFMEHRLAVWFLGIRKDYRNGRLGSDRIKLLKDINFPFDPRNERWLQTFNNLMSWVQKTNRLPQSTEPETDGEKLHNWYKYQITKMENNVLEEDRKLKILDLMAHLDIQ